jgi:hypothetical protein
LYWLVRHDQQNMENFMDIKNNWTEILKWAAENENNKKDAIKTASRLIFLLTDISGKNISKEELAKIYAGFEGVMWTPHM